MSKPRIYGVAGRDAHDYQIDDRYRQLMVPIGEDKDILRIVYPIGPTELDTERARSAAIDGLARAIRNRGRDR